LSFQHDGVQPFTSHAHLGQPFGASAIQRSGLAAAGRLREASEGEGLADAGRLRTSCSETREPKGMLMKWSNEMRHGQTQVGHDHNPKLAA